VLFTTPRGGLDDVVPAAGTSALCLDPADPTPSLGGTAYPRPRQVRAGPVEQSPRRSRRDVASFETPPLSADLLLAGRVAATIWSTTDGGAADVTVTLVDIDERGAAINVTDGIRRLGQTSAGSAVAFDVDLGDIAHVVRRGHRLGIDVAAAAYPRFDLRFPSSPSERLLVHGGATPSQIRLPVAS
jgi:putative CocE/NonD family hydrolase